MKKGQISKRGEIQDILCPFTDIVITQGSGYADGNFSHKGTRAVDVRGIEPGVKYPYYAPFDCKAVFVDKSYGETVWQSLEKVRFTDGNIDYCTFLTVHDDTHNFGVGYVAKQGEQIGNMGVAGYATGVHCHIEFAKGKQRLAKNSYGVWGLTNAVEIEDACFMDNTNIIVGVANWKYLKDVKVEEEYFVPNVDYKLLYNINIRKEPRIGDNIPKVKDIDPFTRTLLTSKNSNDNAIMKAGTEITPAKIVKSDNRIWLTYGNCYICGEDIDKTKLVKKI